jgi:hypothetical protein
MQSKYFYFFYCFHLRCFYVFSVFQLMRQDLRTYYGVFTQSKNCGVRTAYRYQAAARKQQQRNDVFCAVRADVCARSNGIRHAIAKQLLHYKRGTVFSARSLQRCYEQNSSGVSSSQGVPQGSVLSPTLYITVYIQVLCPMRQTANRVMLSESSSEVSVLLRRGVSAGA